MKKLIFLLAAFLALPAYATCTQTSADGGKTITIACTTGSEADPTIDATLGIRLDNIAGFSVMAHAATNMTSGGILKAFLWNSVLAKWVRVTDGTLDLVTSASTDQAWSGYWVFAPGSRVTFVPYGTGVATTIYLVGVARN